MNPTRPVGVNEMLTLDAGTSGITLTDQERAHVVPALARLVWHLGDELGHCELPDQGGGDAGIDEMLEVVDRIDRVTSVLRATRAGIVEHRDPALGVLTEGVEYANGPVIDHLKMIAMGERGWDDEVHEEDKLVVALLLAVRDRVATLPADDTTAVIS